MNLTKLSRPVAAGLVGGLLVTAGLFPMVAHAATAPAYPAIGTAAGQTEAPIYVGDVNSGITFAAGTQMSWSTGVVATAQAWTVAPTAAQFDSTRLPYNAADSLNQVAFLSAPGQERTISAWKAYSSFGPLNGKGALLANITPSAMLNGTPGQASVHAAGGSYSLGVAYTSDTNNTIVSHVYFTSINVDANGSWAFATPVTKSATTTALSASATQIAAGDSVTLTATVTPTTATGNVTFMNGTTTLGTAAAASGVATFTTTSLPAGANAITAVYAGDATNNSSTSAAVTVNVNGTTGPDATLLTSANQQTGTTPTTATLNGTSLTIGTDASLNGRRVNVFTYPTTTFAGQFTVTGGNIGPVNVAGLAAGAHQVSVVDAVSGNILGWANFTIVNAAQTATRNLSAVIATSVDGVFALVGPANSTPAVIGNPTLDSVTGESVSTGTLGAFQVKDDRSISKKGWTLTADVNDFVNGTTTIAKKALGIAPTLDTTTNSGPGLPTLGAATVAGSASYATSMPFAQLAAGTYDTVANMNANLTFRAPLGTPAGTYTSTLTLTLVSK